MSRKRNSSSGFSITSFVNNILPNWDAGSNRFDYVPALGRDMLYSHQIASAGPNAPYALDERSVFVGGICEEPTSAKVFYRLQKATILNEANCVDTRKLEGSKFSHQIAVLSVPRQRELVNLLFWWEEECVRLRKLIQEEKDLSKNISALEKGEDTSEDVPSEIMDDDQERKQLVDHLKFEREKLRMRIRQRPSQRREDVENNTDTLFSEAHSIFNRYDVRAHSEPNVRSDHREFEPPAYRP